MHLKFVAKNHESMPTFYANAMSGGWSPRGDLVVHFALEYAPTLEHEEVIIENGVTTVLTNDPPPSSIVTRDYQCRIVLPLTQMESIVEWFSARLEESRRLMPVQDGQHS